MAATPRTEVTVEPRAEVIGTEIGTEIATETIVTEMIVTEAILGVCTSFYVGRGSMLIPPASRRFRSPPSCAGPRTRQSPFHGPHWKSLVRCYGRTNCRFLLGPRNYKREGCARQGRSSQRFWLCRVQIEGGPFGCLGHERHPTRRQNG